VSVDVSIIVRCYNEEKHIGRLLSGILAQDRSNVEVIIVDSGSDDATLSIASNYPVKIIRIEPKKFSFGYSLNKGCENSSGKYLVFASAHVYPVYRDWLDKLLQPLENIKIALCYGKQRGNNQTQYSERQIFQKWFPDDSCLDQDGPFCNNANAAIRREIWESKKYNEDLTGLEDLDWAKRVMDSGYGISYISEAEVIHIHDESMKNIFNRYRREAIALKQIFPDECLSILEVMKLSSANIWNDYRLAWRDRELMEHMISILVFRLMQFSGGYRGGKESVHVSGRLKETFYYPRGVHHKPAVTGHTQNRVDYSGYEKKND